MGQTLQASRLPDVASTDPIIMAERLMDYAPASDAEALKLLRASFPEAPLSLRVAALAFLMRRSYPGRAIRVQSE
jgi:hypothetical protein